MKLRMIKQLTATLLCVALLAGIPALATFEEDALPAIPTPPEVNTVVELPEWGEETSLIGEELEEQAQFMSTAEFSVTVPTTLSIHMDANGGITCGDIVITNNGTESVEVEDAQISALNGWTLVDYTTTTFTNANKGQHKVALQLGSLDGYIASSGGQKTIGVAAKIPYQGAKSTHADIAQVVLVLGVQIPDASADWEYTTDDTTNTITLTKYIGESNDVVVHDKYAVGGVVYEKVALGESSGYYIDSNEWDPKGPFVESEKQTTITSITFGERIILPTDMSFMFNNCCSLTTLNGISNLDTSNVTDMKWLFRNCSSLVNIDGLSNWNTSSVTDMSLMFLYCPSLSNIDSLSDWDTEKVTNMCGMFSYCKSLLSLDALSNWDVGSVTNMDQMFCDCASLTNLDGISGWDVGSVTDMNAMFYGCSSLTNLGGISGWDVGNVMDMGWMFYDCRSLTALDLSGWSTGSVRNMGSMFKGCCNLSAVTLSNKFAFIGSYAYLPTPDPAYIPDADGYWYTADGTCYTPSEIPNNTTATYYAAKPVASVTPKDLTYDISIYLDEAYDENGPDGTFHVAVFAKTDYTLSEPVTITFRRPYNYTGNDVNCTLSLVDGGYRGECEVYMSWRYGHFVTLSEVYINDIHVGDMMNMPSMPQMNTVNSEYSFTINSVQTTSIISLSLDEMGTVIQPSSLTSTNTCTPSIPTPEPGPAPMPEPSPESVQYTLTISGSSTVEAGSTTTLDITKTPEDNATISWSSSNEAIATVDEFGMVTGIGTGEVTISAQVGETVCQWIMTVTDIPDTAENPECQTEDVTLVLTRHIKAFSSVFSCGPYRHYNIKN